MIDKARLEGRRVIASVSGGKDSAALSLWMTEQGIEHERVFLDTGWEHEATYDYLNGELQNKLGPITTLRGPLDFPGLCRKKGMFPNRKARFCTQMLKILPIAEYFIEDEIPVINAIGIRHAESEARANLPEWEDSYSINAVVWRPLIEWDMDDVIATHKRHNLMPNPLYLKGAARVGCWPCIYSRKSEIRMVADLTPERIDFIRQLESELKESAARRYAERGETFDSLGYTEPTFFHVHSKKDKGMIRIDDAVEWSRTAHGGKQMTLFDKAPPGCVRWGLCEHEEG